MASYGGVSTSTGEAYPLSGHGSEHSGLSPHGANHRKPATVEWGYALRVQLPYTQGTGEIPLEGAHKETQVPFKHMLN